MAKQNAKRELVVIAREVNVRLEKAAQAEGSAIDHRLAAALRLADAEKVCKSEKIDFRKWCDEHVSLSWETARKLVAIGSSGNEKQARLALEDLRERTRAQVAKSRAKAAAAKAIAPAQSEAVREAVTRGPAPERQAREALAALQGPSRDQILRDFARASGLAVVSRAAAEIAADNAAAARHHVSRLGKADRLIFLRWLSDKEGFTLVALKPETEVALRVDKTGEAELPAFLDRQPAKPARRRGKKAEA
jgi:hypothetical protein